MIVVKKRKTPGRIRLKVKEMSISEGYLVESYNMCSRYIRDAKTSAYQEEIRRYLRE